jgi:hypothetical protein
MYSHSAKCQNIMTLENERGALGSWRISNQLQWLGFGLLVAPRASTAIKRLDCAPSSLYNLPLCCLGQGEKHLFPCYSLKNTVLFTSVQAVISLRLSEGISDYITAQPSPC